MAIFTYTDIIGTYWLEESNGTITHLHFGAPSSLQEKETEETPLLKEAHNQLTAYFEGKLKQFDLPLAPKGTPFQQKVWQLLQEIPYGETRTYGHIATSADNPKASRAVGMANNRNPIAIIIPCHRVVGANGKLVGYAGGLAIKEVLLNIESPFFTL